MTKLIEEIKLADEPVKWRVYGDFALKINNFKDTINNFAENETFSFEQFRMKFGIELEGITWSGDEVDPPFNLYVEYYANVFFEDSDYERLTGKSKSGIGGIEAGIIIPVFGPIGAKVSVITSREFSPIWTAGLLIKPNVTN